jgi:hypothetical protein
MAFIEAAASVRVLSKFQRAPGFANCQEAGETLYVYLQDWLDDETNEYDAKWRVSRGPNQPFAPPPPTWREHLCGLGYRLDTQDDVERACIQRGLEPEDLDRLLNGFGWEDTWDNFTGPQAKAFHLLKKLDLGSAPDSKLKQAARSFSRSSAAARATPTPGSS